MAEKPVGVPLLASTLLQDADTQTEAPLLEEEPKAKRKSPLTDPAAHRALAEHVERRGQSARAQALREVAAAVEGKSKPSRSPQVFLTAQDRMRLRHVSVAGEPAELFSLCGEALVGLLAGQEILESVPLDSAVGAGREAAARALYAAVRTLGMAAPLPQVWEADRPPFFAARGDPGLGVSAQAVAEDLPEGELRFFAGRALFSLCPDLRALRLLERSKLKEGLGLLEEALFTASPKDERAAVLQTKLSPASIPKLRALYQKWGKQLSLSELMDGARHSVNRAGLLVAGGVGPALSALRHKRARRDELEELLAFAAGEIYPLVRWRKLGGDFY